MNILQVIYSLTQGGAERFVVNLSNELADKGHAVTLCIFRSDELEPTMTFNRQFLNGKVKFINMNIPAGFSMNKIKQVESLVNQINPDIIHCHLNVIPYFYRMAIMKKNIKIFHTLHNVAEKTYGSKLQYYINKFFYGNKLIIPVAISKECQLSYKRHYHLPSVPYINNGCPKVLPTERFSMTQKEVSSFKMNTNDLVFIHVARFHPQKNQELLIKSFNKLAFEGRKFTLLIIGDKFDTPKGMELQQKACPNIHFLGLKSNVGDYLLCSDAFCLSSFYEGLPISLLEALSCGCVPVCTPVGGIIDVITDQTNGYLSKDLSVEAYTSKIKEFMNHPELISKEKLTSYFKDNFSMEQCTDKYLQLYLSK